MNPMKYVYYVIGCFFLLLGTFEYFMGSLASAGVILGIGFIIIGQLTDIKDVVRKKQ